MEAVQSAECRGFSKFFAQTYFIDISTYVDLPVHRRNTEIVGIPTISVHSETNSIPNIWNEIGTE